MNRHIKKYYFYLLGLYYDLFKRYDDAVEAYAEVMRYRFFFANVQSKFSAAYKNRLSKSKLAITGGVGDFLQCLPYIMANKSNDYVVITHFPKAKEFFESFGIPICKIYTCTNPAEEKSISQDVFSAEKVYRCPRDLFFKDSPLTSQAISYTSEHRPIIGVHMSSSHFAVSHEIKKGLTPKALPKEFTVSLLNALEVLDFNVILFGTKKEIIDLGVAPNMRLKIASDDDITKNLASVNSCHAFIGSDSAFKTMSSMLKIPTIVLYSKEKNNFRDRMFIDPYVKNGVIYPFRYQNFSDNEINTAITFVTKTLTKLTR
ncbi:MAG: hypothetical protein EBU03_04905 [Methylophilaceae bacterium]|nr:hypothetical protein [Methylophilaceae bacterium]